MYKSLVLTWLTALLSALLVACGGGGGSAGAPISGPGSVAVPPPVSTLQVGLFDGNNASTSSVGQTTNNYLQARLRDGAGTAISGKVVTFRVGNAALVSMFPADGTALTDAAGFAKVTIAPAAASPGGATTVNVSAVNGTETVSSDLSFTVAAAAPVPQPTVQVSLFNANNQQITRISQSNGNFALARVVDGGGNPVVNRIVTFSSGNAALLSLSPADGTSLTDSAGYARVAVQSPAGTPGGAVTLSVRANLAAGGSVSNQVDLAVDAAAAAALPTLQLTLRNANGAQVNAISLTGSNYMNARVLDGAGQPVANRLVQFTVANGSLATLFPSDGSALTDAFGEARVGISPAPDTLGGATSLSARAFVGAAGAVGQIDVAVTGVSATAVPTLVAGLRDGTDSEVTSVKSSNGNNAYVLLRDANGFPITNKRVVFSVAGADLVRLSPTDGSALTDSNGFARIGIEPIDAVRKGATTLSVDAQVGTVSLQKRIDFSVVATATTLPVPTLRIYLYGPTNQPTTSLAHVPGHFALAQLLDSAGAPVANRLVTFAVANGALAALSPTDGTALTDAAGYARVGLAAVAATAGGATSLSVRATLADGNVSTQADISVQAAPATVPAPLPSIVFSLRNASGAAVNTIATGNGNYMAARVLDGAGVAVPNKLVQFSVANAALVTMFPADGSALTDSLGEARVSVSPVAGTLGGATTLRVAALVGTTAIAAQLDAAVSAPSSSLAPTIQVGVRNASDQAVTIVRTGNGNYAFAILSDGTGAPVVGRRVTFALSGSAIASFSPADGSALTDSAGFARVGLEPTSAIVSGALSVRANSTVGTTAVTGATDFSITATSTTLPQPTVRLGLFNATNAAVTNIAVGAGNYATATVLDAAGAPVVGKRVVFSLTGSPVALLTPTDGTALTDASGVARVQVAPLSLSSNGALTLRAATTVGTTDISANFDFSVSASAVNLSAITAATSNVASGANVALSVNATLVGTGAAAAGVSVAWSASCGTIDTVVLTTGAGLAVATYSSVQGNGGLCSGDVTISASTAGATAVTRVLTVAPPQANTINFLSATPAQIFLKGSGATEQSLLTFTVLAGNTPLQNVQVSFSITTNPGGVSLGVSGSLAAVTATSNAQGQVSVPVFAGAIPGSVEVRAALSTNAAVFSLSRNLTVASGPPSQRFMSLSVGGPFNIEGGAVDGTAGSLSVRVADRLGNAVPDGTVINFVAEGGQVGRSCATTRDANNISSCSVGFISQNPRPLDGRVSFLAYAEGVKDFVDINGDNQFTPGVDTLTNLGDAYLNSNENGLFDAGEFVVPRGGTVACAGIGGAFPSRANTCTDVNSVATTVRQQAIVMFSASQASFVTATTALAAGFVIKVNSAAYGASAATGLLPMPSGSTVKAEVTGVGCTVKSVVPAAVANISPGSALIATPDLGTFHNINLEGCVAGASTVSITVTSPLGAGIIRTFALR